VLLLDGAGRVTFANAAARRLQAQALPSAWPDAAEIPPVLEWPVAHALLTGAALRDAPISIALPGRGERCMSVSMTTVTSAEVDGTSAVLTMADVTDRKRCEAWEPVMASLARL
jgi:nitrogen fixation/metabolism regulation signal transduction histidine kinase